MTDALLAVIADKRETRDGVALAYAEALVLPQRDEVDWPRVNQAVMDRWSPSALKYVKAKAWRIYDRRVELAYVRRVYGPSAMQAEREL